MTDRVPVRCPHCGEVSELEVNRSGGAIQDYGETCPVCGRAWQVRVTLDDWGDPQVAVHRQTG